jgi:DNA-binding NtrC family response regulator
MAGRDERLARLAKIVSNAAPARPAATRRAAAATVLVTDGDESYRDSVSLQLRAFGFASLEAGNAAEALQFFVRGDKIDLLLTDAAPPGMAVNDLIDGVHALRPGLPYIIMTEQRVSPTVALRPDILRKPFKAEQLMDKIEASLEQAHKPK